jgi:hypothetical protein
MPEAIEVTDAMVEAGIDAVNNLRRAQVALRKRETVDMSWADLLSAAYAGMELRRRRDEMCAALLRDVRPVSRA